MQSEFLKNHWFWFSAAFRPYPVDFIDYNSASAACACVCDLCVKPYCVMLSFCLKTNSNHMVLKTMNSKPELGKHLTVPPFQTSNHHPSLFLSFNLQSLYVRHHTSHYIHMSWHSNLHVCFFPHLSNLISCTGAFTPQQCEDGFISVWSGWWEIEFLLREYDLLINCRSEKQWENMQLGNKTNERNCNIWLYVMVGWRKDWVCAFLLINFLGEMEIISVKQFVKTEGKCKDMRMNN